MTIDTAFIHRAISKLRATGQTHLVEAAVAKLAEASREDFIREAGLLNNHPALVNVDHVSFMGFMDRDECERHVDGLYRRIERAEKAAA